jgi:hypothetical protein
MKFLRYLRIAFSVTCGIACVVLIALWVRSYWREDTLSLNRPYRLIMVSLCGDVQLFHTGFECMFASEIDRSFDVRTAEILPEKIRHGKSFSFTRGNYEGDLEIDVPHWCPIVVMASLVVFPWIKWSNRFTLRNLLTVTTLVAVVLGLIVYATR